MIKGIVTAKVNLKELEESGFNTCEGCLLVATDADCVEVEDLVYLCEECGGFDENS
jgi:hypothetical protein